MDRFRLIWAWKSTGTAYPERTYMVRLLRGVYLAVEGDTKAPIIEGDAWRDIKEFDNGECLNL